MSDTTTETTWRGWYRTNKREDWRQMCEAPDYSGCWSLLLDSIADRRGAGGEMLVSREHPGDRPPGSRQRRCF